MIRVGRCKYGKNGQPTYPSYPNFTPIIVLGRNKKWGNLSPYKLADENNRIMENIWQFSKVYQKVPASTQYYSRWNKKIIWSHPSEIHYTNNQIQPAYWAWREKGMNNQYPVRFPNGRNNRHKCLFAIKEGSLEKLDYIDARKQIYVPIYCELVKSEAKFKELQNKLNSGENLLIIDADGPHQESLQYYINTYGVNKTFIENDTMLAIDENLTIMLNDEKHPFGHGYCLAMALLNMENLTELF